MFGAFLVVLAAMLSMVAGGFAWHTWTLPFSYINLMFFTSFCITAVGLAYQSVAWFLDLVKRPHLLGD